MQCAPLYLDRAISFGVVCISTCINICSHCRRRRHRQRLTLSLVRVCMCVSFDVHNVRWLHVCMFGVSTEHPYYLMGSFSVCIRAKENNRTIVCWLVFFSRCDGCCCCKNPLWLWCFHIFELFSFSIRNRIPNHVYIENILTAHKISNIWEYVVHNLLEIDAHTQSCRLFPSCVIKTVILCRSKTLAFANKSQFPFGARPNYWIFLNNNATWIKTVFDWLR